MHSKKERSFSGSGATLEGLYTVLPTCKHTHTLLQTHHLSCINIGHVIVILQNTVLSVSVSVLITLNMQLELYSPSDSIHFYSHYFSDKTTMEFMSKQPAALAWVFTQGTEGGTSTSPPHVNLPTDGVSNVLRSTINAVVPLKKRIIKQKRLAPWYTN